MWFVAACWLDWSKRLLAKLLRFEVLELRLCTGCIAIFRLVGSVVSAFFERIAPGFEVHV